MHTHGTFVLGLGCQKGGTTWLNEYLADSPQFEPGFKKEYHVFDHLDFSEGVPEKVTKRARRMLAQMDAQRPARSGPLLWAGFYADPETYFDYFAGLMTRDGVRASGDITPLYARLGADRLTDIRKRFAARGIRTVAVFLMRDPVERIWSGVRMRQAIHGEADGAKSAEEEVRARYAGKFHTIRTRYDRTLAAISAAFDPDDVFVEFYERLFDESTLRRLTDLVGIDFHAPDLDYRANATAKTDTLSPETARLVANHFRPVYEDVARRFPDLDLASLWPSATLLDEPFVSASG